MFVRIKKGYTVLKIGQDSVALFVDGDTVDMRQGIVLNPVAELLFNELIIGCDSQELSDKLLSVYDVPKEKAEQDAAAFVKNLSEKGLLE
ncbi:MAG: PqqD family protein [Acutalibacteraceae bacterium]|jgi:hypothetical protein|nr:PqqD family protein [Acutalibacteraceae bacterium]